MKNKMFITIAGITFFGVTIFSNSPLAFAQGRTYSHPHMMMKLETRLNQEVSDGKMTNAQKQLVLTKFHAVQAKRTQVKAMTKEQKKAFFASQRKELLDWAKENDINPLYIFGAHSKIKKE